MATRRSGVVFYYRFMDSTFDMAHLSCLLARSTPRKLAKLRAVLNVLPKISDEDLCVDIGTAHGGLTHYYSKLGSWTYIDVDKSNLNVARGHLKGNFLSNSEEFFKQNKNLRLIIAVDVLEYIPTYPALLEAAQQSLRSGGNLLLVGGEELRNDALIRCRRKMVRIGTGERCYPGAQEIERQLQRLNFNIKKSLQYCGPFTLALQTLIDILVRDRRRVGDQLTLHAANLKASRGHRLLWGAWVLRMASLVTLFLDKITPFLPRYAWVILAEKP